MNLRLRLVMAIARRRAREGCEGRIRRPAAGCVVGLWHAEDMSPETAPRIFGGDPTGPGISVERCMAAVSEGPATRTHRGPRRGAIAATT